MADVELERRQDITPTPDADPLLGSVASEVVRYLASFAMTAVATAVAVGRDGPSCTETSVQGPVRFVRQTLCRICHTFPTILPCSIPAEVLPRSDASALT